MQKTLILDLFPTETLNHSVLFSTEIRDNCTMCFNILSSIWVTVRRPCAICRGVLLIPVLPLLSLFLSPSPCCRNYSWEKHLPHFPLLPQIWEIWFRKRLEQSGAAEGHGEVDGEDTAALVWERTKGQRPQRGHATHLTQGIRRKQKAEPKLSEEIGVCWGSRHQSRDLSSIHSHWGAEKESTPKGRWHSCVSHFDRTGHCEKKDIPQHLCLTWENSKCNGSNDNL